MLKCGIPYLVFASTRMWNTSWSHMGWVLGCWNGIFVDGSSWNGDMSWDLKGIEWENMGISPICNPWCWYIKTYMTGWFCLGKCWCAYSSTMEHHMGIQNTTSSGWSLSPFKLLFFGAVDHGRPHFSDNHMLLDYQAVRVLVVWGFGNNLRKSIIGSAFTAKMQETVSF